MSPVNCDSHADYQNFVTDNLRKYYPNPDALAPSTWDIIERFWSLGLSYTDELARDKYSKFSPAPRTPSCIQRSYLLSINFKVTSTTYWAVQFKINPLYAILDGFEAGDTSGTGTFYDLFERLWGPEEGNLFPRIHPVKAKAKKLKDKGAKAESVEKTTVAGLFPQLENISLSIEEQPYHFLLQIYKKQFLDVSILKGLISRGLLSVVGDGTPVVTSYRMRPHRICDCVQKGISDCSCDCYFSQLDCGIGWDPSRECWYHGYSLYMFAASDSEGDLPVFPLLNPISRHDSLGLLGTFFRMKSFLPDLHTTELPLDPTHDAVPVYRYYKRESITSFIGLNEKHGIKAKYKNDFTIGEDSIPVCKEGYRMNYDDCEPSKHRLKFRCPPINRKYGYSREHSCFDSEYGRTVHLAMKDSPRLINIPPRGSEEWKMEFHTRISTERSNRREKLDFKLEDGRHRSTKMWYCRLYHIMMLQHLDAWDLPFESTLRELISEAA